MARLTCTGRKAQSGRAGGEEEERRDGGIRGRDGGLCPETSHTPPCSYEGRRKSLVNSSLTVKTFLELVLMSLWDIRQLAISPKLKHLQKKEHTSVTCPYET